MREVGVRTNVRELLVSSQLSSAGETLTNIITLPRHDQSGQRKHTRTTTEAFAHLASPPSESASR